MSKRDDFVQAVTGILWPDGGEDVDPEIVGRIANVAENLFGEVVDCAEVAGSIEKVVMVPGKEIQVIVAVCQTRHNKLALIDMGVGGVSIRSAQMALPLEPTPEENPEQMQLEGVEPAVEGEADADGRLDPEVEVEVEVEDDPDAEAADEQPTPEPTAPSDMF